MSKNIKIFILGCLTILFYDLVIRPRPDFNVGDCSKDKLHGDYRKVTKVREYVYNYCKFVDNKCDQHFFMRIKDYDRLMEKTECPEAK